MKQASLELETPVVVQVEPERHYTALATVKTDEALNMSSSIVYVHKRGKNANGHS